MSDTQGKLNVELNRLNAQSRRISVTLASWPPNSPIQLENGQDINLEDGSVLTTE